MKTHKVYLLKEQFTFHNSAGFLSYPDSLTLVVLVTKQSEVTKLTDVYSNFISEICFYSPSYFPVSSIFL